MCIAICKPEGVIIPPSHLEESFKYNNDGAGFAYADNNELHILKGFMTYDEFYEAYKPHKEKAAAIHFRITTHGDTDAENTHPFQVGKNLAVIHNGIISRVDRKSDLTRSDTYHFNTKYLSQFYRRDSRFIFKEHYTDLIEGYIGASKLVFINNKGHYKIINEQAGVWDEGIWYSNTSYRPWKAPQTQQAITPYQERRRETHQSSLPNVFTQGARVSINHPRIHGKGTIMHFTGGMMVGVLVDGDTQPSLIPMSSLDLYEDPHKNLFVVGDWVVRTTDMENKIAEVTGTSKQQVWVRYIGKDYQPEGPTYVMNMDKLIAYDNFSGV